MITIHFTCDGCGFEDHSDVRHLSEPVYRRKPDGWKKRSRWQDSTQIYCPDCVSRQDDDRQHAAKLRADAAKLRAAAKLLEH